MRHYGVLGRACRTPSSPSAIPTAGRKCLTRCRAVAISHPRSRLGRPRICTHGTEPPNHGRRATARCLPRLPRSWRAIARNDLSGRLHRSPYECQANLRGPTMPVGRIAIPNRLAWCMSASSPVHPHPATGFAHRVFSSVSPSMTEARPAIVSAETGPGRNRITAAREEIGSLRRIGIGRVDLVAGAKANRAQRPELTMACYCRRLKRA
jgi:hypothetical protein